MTQVAPDADATEGLQDGSEVQMMQNPGMDMSGMAMAGQTAGMNGQMMMDPNMMDPNMMMAQGMQPGM